MVSRWKYAVWMPRPWSRITSRPGKKNSPTSATRHGAGLRVHVDAQHRGMAASRVEDAERVAGEEGFDRRAGRCPGHAHRHDVARAGLHGVPRDTNGLGTCGKGDQRDEKGENG